MTSDQPGCVWTKICGITNPNDAEIAIEAGADALGFNLWPGSKRYLYLRDSLEWMGDLAGQVERVAVLVNAPLETAREIAESEAIDTVQFHGDESPEYLREFARTGRAFIVARRIDPAAEAVIPAAAELGERVLIDAAVPGAFGGTGTTIRFDVAAQFVKAVAPRRVILAGGLTPENLRAAIAEVRPYGVDVASGVETNPRVKDAAKVRAFVAAARG